MNQPTKPSKTPRQLPDWDQLTFSFTATDVLYRCEGDRNRQPLWEPGEFAPFGKQHASALEGACPGGHGGQDDEEAPVNKKIAQGVFRFFLKVLH